ncbi:hypothetical protein GGR58DRAFT_225203 [Xylaria digitata]|nr:hypothetical protein GGR58DRAFT_225203 [Xylaria digitata]
MRRLSRLTPCLPASEMSVVVWMPAASRSSHTMFVSTSFVSFPPRLVHSSPTFRANACTLAIMGLSISAPLPKFSTRASRAAAASVPLPLMPPPMAFRTLRMRYSLSEPAPAATASNSRAPSICVLTWCVLAQSWTRRSSSRGMMIPPAVFSSEMTPVGQRCTSSVSTACSCKSSTLRYLPFEGLTGCTMAPLRIESPPAS